MDNINGRLISNMITKIKKYTVGLKSDLKFTEPSFVVKDAIKRMPKEDWRNESINERNVLMEWIAENKIADSFNNLLRLSIGNFPWI